MSFGKSDALHYDFFQDWRSDILWFWTTRHFMCLTSDCCQIVSISLWCFHWCIEPFLWNSDKWKKFLIKVNGFVFGSCLLYKASGNNLHCTFQQQSTLNPGLKWHPWHFKPGLFEMRPGGHLWPTKWFCVAFDPNRKTALTCLFSSSTLEADGVKKVHFLLPLKKDTNRWKSSKHGKYNPK